MRVMSQSPQVPSWGESDGIEVWLVAEPGRGRISDLDEAERIALTGASSGAVLAANADADDLERVAQLETSGYRRVFSVVDLERGTAAVVTASAPGSIAAGCVTPILD